MHSMLVSTSLPVKSVGKTRHGTVQYDEPYRLHVTYQTMLCPASRFGTKTQVPTYPTITPAYQGWEFCHLALVQTGMHTMHA